MEEEGIGLVLARATELRFKISNLIHKATVQSQDIQEADDEDETLLNIFYALESLETQLSALQNLQQRQRYEKDTALSEIDYSRKMLLRKLKDYKGKELAVIHEASIFASETIDHNNNLLLPPYPSCSLPSLAMDNGFLSEFPLALKFVQNGPKKNSGESDSNSEQSSSKNSRKRLGVLVNVAAKAVLTFGVITILNLAGFGPKNTHLKILGLFHQPATEGKRSTIPCPPGKVLVLENGEARCLVKERIEVPFEPVVRSPNANYGCG